MKKIIRLLIGVVIPAFLILPPIVFAAPVQGVLERPALKAQNPSKAVLMDVTFAGNRLVAVGERGIIIFSDDSGDTWQQADVPVSVTLTAVYFTGPDNGWAVGHGGVVVHTADGGKTWTRQLEGVTAAKLALDVAQAYADRADAQDYAAQQLLFNVELLVEDGPDKPFLDLYFYNDHEGYVVGSYGYIFRTDDGGVTWKCLMDRVDNPDGLNIYAIQVVGTTIYLAGEQGLFLVSRDNGDSFKLLETPYEGTYFDIEVLPSGDIILVGLRGNAFWSADDGATFNKSDTPEGAASFSDIVLMENGALVFANQAGILLQSLDHGRTIYTVDSQRVAPISSILPMGNNIIMTAGLGGAIRVQLSLPDVNNKGGGQP